jgi:ankyrin repeat protein
MLKSLLERGGLDPNRAGKDGLTMFQRTCTRGPVEVVELKIAHGADINRVAPNGRTAISLATRAGLNLIVDTLLAHGSKTDSIQPIDEWLGACMRVAEADVRRILDAHPRLTSSAGEEEFEALVHAAATNILPRARLMLESGLSPAGYSGGGFTPLHAAAWHGHVDMVQLLIQHSAPLDAADQTYGSSPLAWAAHGSRNALDAAARYQEIVAMLFEAGAHYESAVSHSGVLPEDLASEPVAQCIRERAVTKWIPE